MTHTDTTTFSSDRYILSKTVVFQAGIGEKTYTYTAREWDSESATYYYRARQYNPSIGRFIARDSIGYEGGINLYTYVNSNPVNYVDPVGLYTPIGLPGLIRKIIEDETGCVCDRPGPTFGGCTDPAANNFDPIATMDDGSCTYDGDRPGPTFGGCTDPAAINFNPTATMNDGSCKYKIKPLPPPPSICPGGTIKASCSSTDDPYASFPLPGGQSCCYPCRQKFSSCLAACIENKDPLNVLEKAILGGAGITHAFPETIIRAFRGKTGMSKGLTTVESMISKAGRMGMRSAPRVVGRIISAVATPLTITYGLYMALEELGCTADCLINPCLHYYKP